MSIGICLAVHNGLPYLGKQLESIISQTVLFDELHIGFDSCNDHSRVVVEEILIRSNNIGKFFLYDLKFKNHVKSFDFLISRCKTEILVLSDQDDIWLPNKLEIILNNFNNFADLDCLVHNSKLINSEDLVIKESFFDVHNMNFMVLCFKPWYLGKLRFYGCMMAFKRKSILSFLPIPSLSETHDRYLGYNILFKGKVLFIDDKLILFRRHSTNQSFKNGKDVVLKGRSNRNLCTRIFKAFVFYFIIIKAQF